MTSPLDGNGVAAAEAAFNASINNPQMVPCSKCEGRGFHHGFGEDGNDPDWCTECGGSQFNVVPGEETRAIEAAIAAYLASAAPSQTAVEPVAAELAMLVNWLPKLIAALGSKPEHVDDVARLARVHALIPTLTAQAAALVAAERERDEALAEAKKWWLSDCRSLTERNEARAEVATLKARVAELEAGLEPPYEFDRYVNGVLMAEGVTIEAVTDLAKATLRAVRIASRGPNGEAPVLVLLARRLTHQEKDNG